MSKTVATCDFVLVVMQLVKDQLLPKGDKKRPERGREVVTGAF